MMRQVWLAIAVITTLCAGTPAQQVPDFNGVRDETARLLSDLVKIDTSNPPGNETKAAEYIRSVLAREGIPSEIIESAPGRGRNMSITLWSMSRGRSDSDSRSL